MKGSVSRSDAADPARAAALHALLDRPGPPPAAGDPLPPFWHLIYFWDAPRPHETGEDGHVRRGGFIPDFGLEQRMWAAGSLEPVKPLVIGSPMERLSSIEDIKDKHGKAGRLKFVTVRHDIRQDGKALVCRQQLVYRNARRGAAPEAADLPPDARCEFETSFDEAALFRYSALTFNGHRIHYDADYCRNTAGYPKLVVHGPLLATLLAQVAVRLGGDFRRFSYRATAPAFCRDPVRCFAAEMPGGLSLWACGGSGRLCMRAEAVK